VRHQVIMDIACKLELDFQWIEQMFDIQFHDYFAAELRQLRTQAEDGLLALGDNHLRVSQKGQLLLRNICMVFDAYLGPSRQRFSRTI